jgi:transposase-like protein
LSAAVPDPEVSEKKQRRRFTAEYKLRILQEAGQCAEPGQLGALLRREALYSSHLTTWRRQREEGTLQGLSPKKRGRKAKPADPSAERIAQLEKENLRLNLNLRKAEKSWASTKTWTTAARTTDASRRHLEQRCRQEAGL